MSSFVFHWNVFLWKFSFQCLALKTACQILPKHPFQESETKSHLYKSDYLMVFMSSKPYREGILKFKVSENTDLALSRVFVSKIICQNLIFRHFFLFFFFAVEPLMIASLTFPGALVQQVSLFISSPFSLWLPQVADFIAQDLPLSSKEHPSAAKWECISQGGEAFKAGCMDFLQEQQSFPPLAPQQSTPRSLVARKVPQHS